MRKRVVLFVAICALALACKKEKPDPTLTVGLSPNATTYTNGTVELVATVTGGKAKRVEVLIDALPIAEFDADLTYDLDTTQLAEGPYVLSARAVNASNHEFESGTVTVIVDRTLPTLVSQYPQNLDDNVDVNTDIVVTFSEDVIVPQTTDITVTQGASPVSVTAALDAQDATRLIITPDAPFTAPATVNVLVENVRDAAGNAAAQLSWSFTAPTYLRLGDAIDFNEGEAARDVDLYVDDTGVYAAIVEQDPNVGLVGYVAQLTPDGWSPIGGDVTVGSGANPPQHIDLERIDGMLTVAYAAGFIEGAQLVNYTLVRRLNGETWETVGALTQGNTDVETQTDFIELSESDLVVAFSEEDATNSDNYAVYVQEFDGMNWNTLGGPLDEMVGTTDAFIPSVVVDSGGFPVVSWCEGDGFATQDMELHVQLWLGASWTPLASPITTTARFADLAITANDELLIAMIDGSNRDLSVLQFDGTNMTWDPVGSTAFGSLATSADLVIDPNGNHVVTWAASSNIHLARYDGSDWVEYGLLQDPMGAPAADPKLRIGPDGRLYIAFWNNDPTERLAYVYRLNE